MTTLMSDLGSDSAGCSVFCSTRKAVLDEVRSSLAHLQPGERVVVERCEPSGRLGSVR